MRWNRTLPPALALALLAGLPLLSGCFDEEIEPVGEPLEAIGPELPEGISVGTDGSIVIDKGLAADGGDPLADGDDGGGFTCTSVLDCWEECKEHCYCEKRQGAFCCCNTTEGELNCDECKGGGCGGGEGGGGGGSGEEGEEKEEPGIEIGLSCTGVTRGWTASCRASTGGTDPDSLRFEWHAGRGIRLGPSYSATGGAGLTWGGRATVTRAITLEVKWEGGPKHGKRVWKGFATVRVSARNWRFDTQNKSPKNSPDISRWGLYLASLPTRGDLYVREGSGPWAGSYYLHGSPEVRGLGMWIHSDLDESGPTYPIPAGDTICGLSNVWRDVHALNKTCGTVGVLNGFRTSVVSHEETHQNSLNKCIRIMNRRWVGHVEEAVDRDRDHVNRVLDRTWGQVVVADLANARLSKQQDVRSNGDAHWYYGSTWWFKPMVARGHSGTDGC